MEAMSKMNALLSIMKGEFEDRVCIFQIALKGSRVALLIVYIQRVALKKAERT